MYVFHKKHSLIVIILFFIIFLFVPGVALHTNDLYVSSQSASQDHLSFHLPLNVLM